MTYILYIIYVVLIAGPIYLIWAIFNINKKMRKVEWLSSQEYTLLRIDVPRNNDKAPLAAEQMFAAIHGIFSESAEFQNHMSFEIVSKDKYIQFYIYVPIHLKDFVEGQVYAQYPTVEINEVEDYVKDIDITEHNFAICNMGLTKPDVYPIKQFTDFEVDPLSGITSVMSKLNPGEEVWFQMTIRPVGDSWQEKGHSMVSAVRSGSKSGGKNIGLSILKGLAGFLKALAVQAIRPGGEEEAAKSEIKLPAAVEEALKNIETKITKLGFETNVRIMTIGSDPVSVRMKCQTVAAAFKQYNTTNLNGFKPGTIHVNDESQWKDFAYRSFENDGYTMNIAELASIFHLPHSSVATPNIVWSGSKKGEPPANLPLEENTPEEELTIIGETNFRNVYRKFGIKKDDRRRHIYMVGKSGVGKSVLIENMAKDDVYKGRGVIIVDPHGELADKILSCIPDERIKDVVVFDPSDREFPVAFNLLEKVDDDFKSLVASGFVGIFKKIFGDSWGPRLEHILRNTVLALLDYPNATMLDIPRMLTNTRFQQQVTDQVKDSVIKDFWLNEFSAYDVKFKTEAVSPILNKVGQFLSSSTIRNIVGQPKSTINIREIMDQKKIMIVNLSRGKIGEDNSALLGAMMITKIQLAALGRADVTIDQRPDSYLYVDEFQNFATESFAVILAEARKYNLNLTMAHQFIAQLKDEVRDAVFGNAGTIISFRVGGADADVLVKEYEPVFEANDLVNLDKFNIYIKLLIDGVSSPAFSARTLPPVQKLSGNFEKAMEHSRAHYSRTRADVEGMIDSRGKEEEDQLKAEAEAFKRGGLEALLVKKGVTVSEPAQKPNPIDVAEKSAEPEAVKPLVPETQEMAKTEEIAGETEKPVGESEKKVTEEPDPDPNGPLGAHGSQSDEGTEGGEQPVRRESRVIKYDNILNGRLYKERTARGNVKWLVGESIDEEKLAKGGIVIDEGGKEIIDLSDKVGNKKKYDQITAHPIDGEKNDQLVGEFYQEKEIEKIPEKTEEREEDNLSDKNENQITENIDESPVPKGEELVVAEPIVPAIEQPVQPVVMPQVSVVEPEKAEEANNSQNQNNQSHTANAQHLEEGQSVKIGD